MLSVATVPEGLKYKKEWVELVRSRRIIIIIIIIIIMNICYIGSQHATYN